MIKISEEVIEGAEGPLQPSTNWLEFIHVIIFELIFDEYLLIFLKYNEIL
jgi:hypothetical protein